MKARALPSALAGLVAMSAGVAFWFVLTDTAGGPVSRLLVEVEPGKHLAAGIRFERHTGPPQRPALAALALSPAGTHLFYAATDEEETRLYLQALGEPGAVRIRGTEGGCCPFFSPDGQSVGFHADGALKRVAISGDNVRTIVAGLQSRPFGASWGDDDTIVFAAGSEQGGLFRVPSRGGAPETLTEVDRDNGERSHRFPHLLPGSGAVLFVVTKGARRWDESEIVLQSLATGVRTRLVEGGADPRYFASGYLLFARDGTLMAVPFDAKRLEIAGRPVQVLRDLMQAVWGRSAARETGAAQFSLSASGNLAYVSGGAYQEVEAPAVWVDRDGATEVIGTPPGDHQYVRMSPDGSLLAYTRGHPGKRNLWVYKLQEGLEWQLTFEGDAGNPVISPDSARLAFSWRTDGAVADLYTIPVPPVPTSTTRLTRSEDRGHAAGSWSRDGVLAYVSDGDIFALPAEGGGEPRVFLDSPRTERSPAFSPDGKWLAYASGEADELDIYVQPYPGPGPPIRVSSEGGSHPAWSRDGRELFYRNGDKMMVVDVTPGETLTTGPPRLLFEKQFMTGDASRSYDVTTGGGFVMVLDGHPEAEPVTRINVIQNWLEELKQLVPRDR